MNASFIIFIGRRALETTLLVSAPILVTCLISGVAITLLQAITSIRDMTLTVVPKLLAVGVILVLFGNWMLNILLQFFQEIFMHIQNIGH
jgi:flagellar biosynthesis protein FliQ